MSDEKMMVDLGHKFYAAALIAVRATMEELGVPESPQAAISAFSGMGMAFIHYACILGFTPEAMKEGMSVLVDENASRIQSAQEGEEI